MTKEEFYQKWKVGSREATIFYNKETMMNDLDRVIKEAVNGWKDFVDSECERLVDLDGFLEAELNRAGK